MGQNQTRRAELVRNLRFENNVDVSINGTPFKVTSEIPPDTTLNTFIREHVGLKGTKFMCLEGGCGACIVSVQSMHPASGQIRSFSVNSCLIPIFACHGWSVRTVEDLGCKTSGYHEIQKRLAAASGTQCGYCSPGMVMNMHSLLEQNSDITMKGVENSFGGNICRCTGYRPILDAFKSLAKDAPSILVNKLRDVEDLHCSEKKENLCEGSACGNKCCSIVCPPRSGKTRIFLDWGNNHAWYRPTTVKEIFEILDMIGDSTYRFVCGHTGQGVYRITEPPQMMIDVSQVPELSTSSVTDDGIDFGGNLSLTEMMEFLSNISREKPNQYSFCKVIADHIDLIANVPVRNVGSIAGNLSLKYDHPEFPSDVFLLLETIGAILTIGCVSGVPATMSAAEYLKIDMHGKLILKITILPRSDESYLLRTYKIMPRAQNSHAYVNAGFLFNLDRQDGFKVLSKPRIVFGGINPEFVHASETEDMLTGKSLSSNDTLTEALELLERELRPDHVLPDATPEYRKGLALSLMYKFILSLDPDIALETYRSGGLPMERPLSSGSQDVDTDRRAWPLNQPIPKLEGLMQCAGELEYTMDTPTIPDQVWAQLVLCDRAVGHIQNIDTSAALGLPGVIAYFGAEDIPGENAYYTVPGDVQDEIFANGKTRYAGQAVGVIIAESHSLAIAAAKKVVINYSKVENPVLGMREVIEKNMEDRIIKFLEIKPKKKKNNVKFTIEGEWFLQQQYHFMMETLTCIVVPKDNQLDVYSSTQFPSSVQAAISKSLNIPSQRINVTVKRVGGGYGAKLDRANHTSAVCALAAHLLHRPVRMMLNLETNMEWMGKRLPNLCKYKVGVSESGEIQHLEGSIHQDNGHVPSGFIAIHSLKHAGNGYDISTFNLKMFGVITDNAWNTWCRAPGSTEHTSMMENIMEHIAKVVNKDPLAVRSANLENGSVLPKMIQQTLEATDYYERLKQVEDFNNKNRWRKRGINFASMSYPFYYRANFHAHVAIFAQDGSVAISHGGVEMGQGINTKAAQVAAKYLGIDLELIAVKPLSVHENPNNSRTGGCQATDSVCYAIMMCCEELNRRLAPYKAKLGKSADWKTVVKAAEVDRVNLRHSFMFTPKERVKPYDIYGVVVTEVELDVLTGQFQVCRVDLHEDAGQSISPEIDIGQIEGSFVMGLGYYTSEQLVYNNETGALLSNRTWHYKPPGAKDIPADFRITFRKNAYNTSGVLGSKGPPCTYEKLWLACQNTIASYRLQ